MIGPSSRSPVTKCAVAPISFTPRACASPVRVRALEPGKEGVVDVDGAPREPLAQLGRQDLHVPREHHQLDVVLVERLEHSALDRRLVGLRLERHAVELGEAREVAVVGEHERDVHAQLAGVLCGSSRSPRQ